MKVEFCVAVQCSYLLVPFNLVRADESAYHSPEIQKSLRAKGLSLIAVFEKGLLTLDVTPKEVCATHWIKITLFASLFLLSPNVCRLIAKIEFSIFCSQRLMFTARQRHTRPPLLMTPELCPFSD